VNFSRFFKRFFGCCCLLTVAASLSAQDTIFYRGDTIRVGELEWDMEKDYKGRGEALSSNTELYGDSIRIYLRYYPNKMVEQILFGYLEGDAFVPHGPARFYYDSGHLLGKRYYQEGLLNGLAEDYFKNGQRALATTFLDNQLEGTFTTYYENGTVDQEGVYHHDTLMGWFNSFYNNGTQQWVEYYDSSGWKQGRDSTFYETGRLESTCEFTDDVEDGEAVFFHRNGRIWSRRTYQNGLLRSVEFIRNAQGKDLDVGSFSAGNGWVNVYNDNGALIEREKFKHGTLVKVKRMRD